MIVSDLIEVATRQFEQKMSEFGKDWDTRCLTAELAQQVGIALQESFSHASREAYKWFVERYDPGQPVLEGQGRTLRFKTVSTKTFLTSFGQLPIARSLYQAETGGSSDVPLDHCWDMDGATVLLREPGARRGRPPERPRPEQAEPKNATYKNAMVGAISFYGAVREDQKGPEGLRSFYSARMPEDRAVTFKRDFEQHLEIVESKLDPGDGVKVVLRSIDYYGHTHRLSKSGHKALAMERTFFRRNQHRMKYASFRRRGLPIGSGPVEAACKSIVRTRLCRSGMRWSREGGQRILNFRCYVKSGLWKEFWDTYRQLRCSA